MRKALDRPNIILINCDDLGYGDLGCYGSLKHKTPAIDRLAEEGILFSSFCMGSPVCSPSRGAMLTGCYPKRIGFENFDGNWVLFPGQGVGLNPREETIASVLKKKNYATKIVGKWHCGDQPEFLPTKHGFDSYYGLPYSNDMGRQEGTPNNPPLPLLRDDAVIQEQPDQAALTERYTEESVRFMRENKDQPFFLYFAHMHVHVPLYVPDRFMHESKNGRYGAAVECINWSVEVILDELHALGLDKNTLLVFTSDNGSNLWAGGSNGELKGAKGSIYEGGFRVPCLAWWPEVIPAGRTCSDLVSSIDLLPTFAKLADAPLASDRVIDGQDFSTYLLGESGAAPGRQTFFYYKMGNLCAVRSGRWKLIVSHCKWEKSHIKVVPVRELYDLENDKQESHNLYSEYPVIVADLERELQTCREDIGDEALGLLGENTRPIGRVENPQTLTEYSEDHPYIIAMYDLPEHG